MKEINFKSLRAPNDREKRSNPAHKLDCFVVSLLAMTFTFLLTPAHAEVVEKIVAVVGSDIVTLYDLDRAMAPYADEIKKSPNKELKFREVRLHLLEGIVNNLLLKQAIENAKINVTNDDIARAIKNVLIQNRITIETLKAELAGKGIPFESYKDDIKRNIQRVKFVNQEIGSRIRISDQELRDYYQKHMSEFGINQSVHIAQIVLPFDEATTKEEIGRLKAKGAEIVREARGGTPFAQLCRQYSKGLNAEKGGDLGIVDPAHLLPEAAAALEKMKVGQISDPILSPAGIHIIHLIDRAQATEADFERLKEKIYNKMYDQRMAEEINLYLSELRKKTYVELRE